MRRLAALVVAGAALWLAPGALAAGWCGTGESATDLPDATTGQQIHSVVVVPADGADNFPAVANKLSDDVASMSSWWTGQDATRTPRFDQAVYPGGTCLDISFFRLTEPGSSFTNASAAFNRITSELMRAGFGSTYKKYYVYYDGPLVQANICGTGGGDFTGTGIAILWLSGCPDVPTDAVGTHELAHALGAVPPGAPHECPPPNDGHVCDSSLDLLYPFTSGQALSQTVLDVNRDDYYGFSANGIDLRNSVWLRHLDAPQVPLAVAMIGGTGRVTSDLPGFDCSVACTTLWDQGTSVSLAAVPGNGRRFVRWGGACTGNAACSVSLTQAAAVTAVFGPAKVPVKVQVTGRGSVRCTPVCAKAFPAGEPLTLRAVPAKGWKFTGWSGGCKGKTVVCRPKTQTALTVRAIFRRK